MCRLFGMSGGQQRLAATFWLLEAPDSLSQQSRREPDGTGLGSFEDGRPVVSKQPLAAYEDTEFAREARAVHSRTFVAHVRYASTGGIEAKNTHPFEMAGRIFAHNGVIGGLSELEAELGGEGMALVHGDTDSERFFALVTRETARAGGDVAEGLTRSARWVAEHLPLFALNVILISKDELWALRYPDTHELHILPRAAGGPHGDRHLEHASRRGSIRVRSGSLATAPCVVVASERMDEDAAWRALAPGELVHISPQLEVQRRIILEGPPAHPLTLAQLDPKAAASQGAAAGTQAGGGEAHPKSSESASATSS